MVFFASSWRLGGYCAPANIDPLWHTSVTARTPFTARSPIAIPALNQFQKPDWRVTRLGITPGRRDNFWMSHVDLKALDYFPLRGDLVFWRGYRYEIMNVVVPPEAYWHQTGVWLGLMVECVVPPEGDATPLLGLDTLSPSERSPSAPDWNPRVPELPLQEKQPLPVEYRQPQPPAPWP